MTEQAKGVDFIVNSKKPYPDWIKSHAVFKELNKIDKVFPRIGLPNFKEPADIMNTAEAKNDAMRLGTSIINYFSTARNQLYTKLDTALKSTEKDRNEICGKIQSAINAIISLNQSMAYQDYVSTADGKVSLKLRADLFNGDKTPLFKKDESILRIYNKIKDMCAEHKVVLTDLDRDQNFKDFSRTNIPNKKYMIAFSSTGEEGAWDIGTISMRGIASCQSWTSPQSKGLIGSISSKFVGVIYVASDQNIPEYGSKMLNRCMVRFAINKNTKKPALLLDNMYPAVNQDTVSCFRKILQEKTKLEVIYLNDKPGEVSNYYIPDEPTNKYLANGEASYMDNKLLLGVKNAVAIKKSPQNLSKITNDFKVKIAADISNFVKTKREAYEVARKENETRRAEYDVAKATFEEENNKKPENEKTKFTLPIPKIEAELASFGGGGVLNLLHHCDKKAGANSAGAVFAKLVLDNIEMPNINDCATPEEFHRKYLMKFLKEQANVKLNAWKAASAGTWMKSFPKSAEKFFAFIFPQVKSAVMTSCKEMIKKAN